MSVYETHAYGAYGGSESADPPEPAGRMVGPLVNWLGAVASLGLIAGLGLWGYNLAMRDVTGIPVIRAMEGPMRVQPDDPGGRQAEHQGLQVNMVQAEGVAEAPADRIVLAPAPIDLSTATPAQDPSTIDAARAVPEIPQEDALPQTADAAFVPAQPEAATAPETSGRDSTGLAVEALLSTLVAEQEAEDLGIVPASLPGVARSPRPKARPDVQFASRAVMDLTAPTAPAKEPEFVEVATLAAGTQMVQFGAFDDAATARAEWEKIYAGFGDYLSGKSPVIQEADRGGRVFFRLRATGFEDLSDARRLCSVVQAENLACIPVVYK